MKPPAAQTSSTPILDLLRPLPRPDQERATGRFAFPFLTFAAIIVTTGNHYFLVLPFGFLAINFLAILTHEFGHLLAGWSVGLHFRGLHADPFRLRIDSGKWKFRVRPRLFHGFAFMSLDKVRRVHRRLIVFTIGGPLASLTSGITAIAFGEVILARADSPGWGVFLDCYGAWSLFLGGGALLYLREGYVSDGTILRALLFSRDEAKQFVAAYAMGAIRSDTLIAPDYFRRWFRMASLPTRLRGGDYGASWLAYLEEEDSAVAAQWLERCLASSELMDEDMRDHLIAEASFFNAYRRGELTKAEKWWKQLTFPETHNSLSRIRVEAGLAWARQQRNCAFDKIDEGLQLLHTLPATTERERLIEAWNKWREEMADRSLAVVEQVVV